MSGHLHSPRTPRDAVHPSVLGDEGWWGNSTLALFQAHPAPTEWERRQESGFVNNLWPEI